MGSRAKTAKAPNSIGRSTVYAMNSLVCSLAAGAFSCPKSAAILSDRQQPYYEHQVEAA